MKHLILILALLSTHLAWSQGVVGFGFRAGLSFSTLDAPSELDANNNELETYNYSTGFVVGALANFRLTDFFGLRTELLYAQKGVQYNYEGPSYFIFEPTDRRVVASGQRKMQLEIVNSYLQIPLMAYAQFKNVEFQGGAYVSALLLSSGNGRLDFRADRLQGTPFEEISFLLEHNYRKDQPGESFGETKFTNVNVDGKRVNAPELLGAYYEFPDGSDQLYRTLDYGLLAGFSLYLNKGLFVNLRGEFGFADITNNTRNVSLSQIEGTTLKVLEETHRNLSFQTSVGFKF